MVNGITFALCKMGKSAEIFMQRALDLARLGLGNVSPNPMVGCVIVHDNKIIGEGFHQMYGGPHAEVNAVDSVLDKALLKRSSVYVTLEPCAHFGKTPPCANLLVEQQVKKVVVASIDPNSLVAGKGLNILKNANIEIETGLLEEEAAELNKRFFKFISIKKPYVILKWAMTSDGYIARQNYDSKWISNDMSRKIVHKWRSEEDAILVGKNTAQYDDPSLNVRDWTGTDPLRAVIDHDLSLPKELKLFNGKIPTIRYNSHEALEERNNLSVKLQESGFYEELLTDLHDRNIQSIIVEGGAQTIQEFIDQNLWDEARVFTAPTCFGSGITAPQLKDANYDGSEDILNDRLTYYRRSNG